MRVFGFIVLSLIGVRSTNAVALPGLVVSTLAVPMLQNVRLLYSYEKCNGKIADMLIQSRTPAEFRISHALVV